MTDIQTHPVIRLLPKTNAQRLRFGAPWVFSDQLVLDRRTKAIAAGSIVEVQDKERKPIALAAFNANSKIIARVLDTDLEPTLTWSGLQNVYAARSSCAKPCSTRLSIA